MKKITVTECILLMLGVLCAICFVTATITTDGLRQDVAGIKQRVIKLNTEILNYKEDVSSRMESQQANIQRLSGQTQVLEASLDSREMRWARIKKARDAIKDYQRAGLTISQMTEIAAAIIDMSEQHDVPVPLILAVIRQESAFHIKARSHAGALGLMQIMPKTAEDMAKELNKRRYHLYKPNDNIDLGTYYLWKMVDRFDGNLDLAVRAYNAGPTFVEKVNLNEWNRTFRCQWSDGSVTQEKYYCETADYVQKVLNYKKEFEKFGI